MKELGASLFRGPEVSEAGVTKAVKMEGLPHYYRCAYWMCNDSLMLDVCKFTKSHFEMHFFVSDGLDFVWIK